jgi:hypothetical protein
VLPPRRPRMPHERERRQRLQPRRHCASGCSPRCLPFHSVRPPNTEYDDGAADFAPCVTWADAIRIGAPNVSRGRPSELTAPGCGTEARTAEAVPPRAARPRRSAGVLREGRVSRAVLPTRAKDRRSACGHAARVFSERPSPSRVSAASAGRHLGRVSRGADDRHGRSREKLWRGLAGVRRVECFVPWRRECACAAPRTLQRAGRPTADGESVLAQARCHSKATRAK